MTIFIIKSCPTTSPSTLGSPLLGQYLKRLSISTHIDEKFPVGPGAIANSDIFKTNLGLLVQGKNDFEAIQGFRGDEFCCCALGITTVPSCATLRQRLNTHACAWFELVDALNLALLLARYRGMRASP